MKRLLPFMAMLSLLAACSTPENNSESSAPLLSDERAAIYTSFTLTTDVNALSEEDKKVLPKLIEAAQIMDGIFWKETYGNKDSLMNSISDEKTRRFAEINYGPWDRLDGDKPFVEGVGEKPKGAQYYPIDMTVEEFEAWNDPQKGSLYTLVRRDADGKLKTVWYYEAFAQEIEAAAKLLEEAAALTSNNSFKYYLELRAAALRTDRYKPSDIAWLNLKDNDLDIVIGPIESYDDKLFGAKASHEAYVLVKDKEWSERLARYSALLPQLQEELPVDSKYKQDPIGSNAQLNAYDVVYYAGDCNSGSKTIAVNLPNDEGLQMEHGTRRSQLKNAMRAKYDKILLPISEVLITPSQRKHITFDAFFGNTMFHEVAHGLGIKNTINGKGTVREALKEEASALEEGKADILGLYMVTKLYERGEIEGGEVMDNYVTFLAGLFRSVRFGASSAHGRANMLRFNYFSEKGAFSKDPETGLYAVDQKKMQKAMNGLSELIIRLQGDGDYAGVQALMEEKGFVSTELQQDLDKLSAAGIPVDVVFEQGTKVLGL